MNVRGDDGGGAGRGEPARHDIFLQCFIGELRIACAEDLMRRMIHPELLFEFCLDIDLGDDAEFLFQKRFANSCLCFF